MVRMTLAERREREKEQRRRDIIEAAERFFFSKKYDNVSMDDIAAATELNKATLYLYFKNKDSLFATIVLRGARILNTMVTKKVEEDQNAADKLWAIWYAYFDFAKQYPEYLRLYSYFFSGRFDLENTMDLGKVVHASFVQGLTDIAELADLAYGEQVRELIELRQAIFASVKSSITMGINEGRFRSSIDPTETAALFIVLMEGIPRMGDEISGELDREGVDLRRFQKDAQKMLGAILFAD
jgi:AcrR family transcriptional regulator